jgi:hypothetical protein
MRVLLSLLCTRVTFFAGALANIEARFQTVNDVSEPLVIEIRTHAFAPTKEPYLTDSFEFKEIIRISSSVSPGATIVHNGHQKHLTSTQLRRRYVPPVW